MNLSIPNFSFVYEDKVAGSAHPGFGRDMAHSLAELRELGISAIVSLTETPLDSPLLEEFGFQYAHLPILDFTPPSLEQTVRAMEFVKENVGQGRAVLIHCTAGQGRTGTMLAAYLVSKGLSPEVAIGKIRQLRPGSVETPDQEKAVFDYDRHLKEGAK